MKYFGTDGIRGVADEFVTEALAFRVGQTLKTLKVKKVVIGRDTRESGQRLAKQIALGAQDQGLLTLDLGIVSTPMLAYISSKLAMTGVMITASHNPYHDNGIKVFKYGKKLFESEEAALETLLNQDEVLPSAPSKGRSLAPIESYKLYYRLIHHMHVKTSLKIGLDLANGATYSIGKRVFQKITPYLHVMGDEPDGKNINLGVGSTHLESLMDLVKREKLDVGFAFDGDGDRVLAVDSDGNVVDGDCLIYVIASYLKEKGKLNHQTVALTKMSNIGIIKALNAQGIEVIQTNVGDKYVLEALQAHHYVLGGESSGHIINRTLMDTGDGILNAVLLVKIMKETRQSLKQLTQAISLYPDKLVNLKNMDKSLLKDPLIIEAIESHQSSLGSEGKVLVRASGTEPLIRIQVQAQTMEKVDAIIEDIKTKLTSLASKQ